MKPHSDSMPHSAGPPTSRPNVKLQPGKSKKNAGGKKLRQRQAHEDVGEVEEELGARPLRHQDMESVGLDEGPVAAEVREELGVELDADYVEEEGAWVEN